jgi:1-acyl-sn-glycerol-3-phosphate acyltransferase
MNLIYLFFGVLRISILIIWIILWVILALIIAPFCSGCLRKHARLWATVTIKLMGIKLKIQGNHLTDMDVRNTLIVSNHISWLDTIIMLSLVYTRYLGKIEMLKWPVLSILIKSGGTIFIDRSKKSQISGINRQLADLLRSGDTIGLYPEGKRSNGNSVLPFKSSIIEAAMLADSRVIPVIFYYGSSYNKLLNSINFSGFLWINSIIKLLTIKRIDTTVIVLPTINATDFTNREDLTQALYQQIHGRYMQEINSNITVK